MSIRFLQVPLLALSLPLVAGCPGRSDKKPGHAVPNFTSVCTGVWPSYWQDPAFDAVGMWKGQKVSNSPESQNWTTTNAGYTNPPFRLADAYATGKADDPSVQKWRDNKFNALFDPKIPAAEKSKLAFDYGWDVMRYMQEGNINSGDWNTDWNLCGNTIRQWFNMPFQTYDVLSGREFVHGLTREAPVEHGVKSQATPLYTTVWAVAFYNGNAAPTLASIWRTDGAVNVPANHIRFAEGTVIGKLLFTTATAADLPFLSNVPRWTANTSMGLPGAQNPTSCKPNPRLSMPEQSEACPRSPRTLTLLQFDFAVEDSRSPIGWVYGTFVADGQAKATVTNPWDRISLLGLMWGNDPPPATQLASGYPTNPRTNGFTEASIAWDVVDRLNAAGGAVVSAQPGHMGCNLRLNGPADNVASSCLSCHMTASVPDKNEMVPPLVTQFIPGTLTPQCADETTLPNTQKNAVSFQDIDGIYFANVHSGTPIQMSVNGKSVLGTGVPTYAAGETTWKSTDFSLQMSSALIEWMEWQRYSTAGKVAVTKTGALANAGVATRAARFFRATLPRREGPPDR